MNQIYHQAQSAPLMESLRVWLNNQLLYHLVEENGGLGQAVRYMLKHRESLTTFLHVPVAPIDNSLCEQAIKVAIRHRRNSLFYKTANGAIIGDCIMSVIHTAVKNQVNPFDYLTQLQRHASEVHKSPENGCRGMVNFLLINNKLRRRILEDIQDAEINGLQWSIVRLEVAIYLIGDTYHENCNENVGKRIDGCGA